MNLACIYTLHAYFFINQSLLSLSGKWTCCSMFFSLNFCLLCFCQEIGLVAFMFFFELLFSYDSSSISFYVSLTNLFSIISFPYLLITRDIQDEGKAGFRFY